MKSLSELIETTGQKFNAVSVQIFNESGLPAYLLEGMVLRLLAEVREKKAAELTQEFVDQNEKLEKQNRELQKQNEELRSGMDEFDQQLKKVHETFDGADLSDATDSPDIVAMPSQVVAEDC